MIELLIILMLQKNVITIVREPVIVEGIVSHYSELDSCHYKGCLTAAGFPPTENTIACPREYPLFTSVQIAGKDYVCHDRLNPGLNRWDIWEGWGPEAHERALEKGIRNETIKIYQ